MIKPIIFYSNTLGSNIFELLNDFYKLESIVRVTRKYKIFKNYYFILSYSDFVILDKSFFKDFYFNKKKVLKYLEKNKKFILFFSYNNKIYNYSSLLKLINFNSFLIKSFYYFLKIYVLNKNFLKIFVYIKQKNANY